MGKHGLNYKAMAKDIKLNRSQVRPLFCHFVLTVSVILWPLFNHIMVILWSSLCQYV